MRCLVTGGCGFIGSALVRRLAATSQQVTVVDDLSRGSAENVKTSAGEVTVVRRDITASIAPVVASARPQVIFHLAAVHYIPDCEADPARCLRVNVDGTRAVLEAAATGDPPVPVVFASSAAVYAPASEPHQEDDPLAPVDVYGYSKRWAEELMSSFSLRTGAGVGIARLFNVFGPGETNPHFIPSLIWQLQAGQPVRLGNLSTRRDYVFVDDVAVGLVSLAEYCRTGQSVTVNLGTGRSHSGQDIVRVLAGFTPANAGVNPALDPGRLRLVDRPNLQAGNDLAQKALGWVPRTSLRDGLRAAWAQPVGAGVRW
jgi:UDP-glucose 4-epimerase